MSIVQMGFSNELADGLIDWLIDWSSTTPVKYTPVIVVETYAADMGHIYGYEPRKLYYFEYALHKKSLYFQRRRHFLFLRFLEL